MTHPSLHSSNSQERTLGKNSVEIGVSLCPSISQSVVVTVTLSQENNKSVKMAVHYTRLNLVQANEAIDKIMAYTKEFDPEVCFGIYIARNIVNKRDIFQVDSVYDTAVDFISLIAKLVSVGATSISYINLLGRVTYKHQGKVFYEVYHTKLWGGDILKGLEPTLTRQYVTSKVTPNTTATINMRDKSQTLKNCHQSAGATIVNTLFVDYYIRKMCVLGLSSTETNCGSCDSAPMQPRKPTAAFRARVDSFNEEIIRDEGIERERELKIPTGPVSAPTTPVLEKITSHKEQESKFFASMSPFSAQQWKILDELIRRKKEKIISHEEQERKFFASMSPFHAQQWKILDGLIRNKNAQRDRERNSSINRPNTLSIMGLLRFAPTSDNDPDPISTLTMPEIERLLAEPRRLLRVERNNEKMREGQVAVGYTRDGYSWTSHQCFASRGPVSGYPASFPRYDWEWSESEETEESEETKESEEMEENEGSEHSDGSEESEESQEIERKDSGYGTTSSANTIFSEGGSSGYDTEFSYESDDTIPVPDNMVEWWEELD